MKKRLQFLTVIIAALLAVTFVKSNSNTQANPKISGAQTVKLATAANLADDISARIKSPSLSDIELSDNNAQLKITDLANDWPSGWQAETIFARHLNLEPEGLAKFFQGPLDEDGLKIYLAGAEKSLVSQFAPIFEESFRQNPPPEWTLVAVGDIMLSRHVDEKMDRNGRRYPFLKTADFLKNADLTMANLESPFTTGESPPEGMVFGAEKASIEGLKYAGFDLVNLANNHFGNQGQKGTNLTFEHLKNNGIDYFGAGGNFNEAHQPLIKEVKSQKIAFLGYTDTDVIPESYIAQNSAGAAAMNVSQVVKDIAAAKKDADLVIVSMHSGAEYTPNPNSRQKEFARVAIDAGADLVIGHHPHVVQAMENYKGKFIFYSLGNFVFDQMWSTETRQGLMVKLTFVHNKIVEIKLVPVKIADFAQPFILKENQEYEEIFRRIFTASEKLR